MDLLENYDSAARRILVSAQAKADDAGHALLTRRHLVSALLGMGHGFRALTAAGIDPKFYEAEVAQALDKIPRGARGGASIDTDLLQTLTRAEGEARRAETLPVKIEHLVRALGRTGDFPKRSLEHWDEEARSPPVATPAPAAPTRPQRFFSNPDVGLSMGRGLLRALTEELHVALDPDASHAGRRAIAALDAVEHGLGVRAGPERHARHAPAASSAAHAAPGRGDTHRLDDRQHDRDDARWRTGAH